MIALHGVVFCLSGMCVCECVSVCVGVCVCDGWISLLRFWRIRFILLGAAMVCVRALSGKGSVSGGKACCWSRLIRGISGACWRDMR